MYIYGSLCTLLFLLSELWSRSPFGGFLGFLVSPFFLSFKRCVFAGTRANTPRTSERCMNDVSFWSTADEIKRIASHERQRRTRLRGQNRYVAWIHYRDPVDYVISCLLLRHDLDCVTDRNVLQSSEEAIPMAGNSDVSLVPWLRRPSNVSNSPIQTEIVGTLQNRNFKMDFGNHKHRIRWSKVNRQTLPVTLNALGRPKSEVRFLMREVDIDVRFLR